MTLQVRLPRILKMFAHNGGRELPVDGETYASESATGHRNRAIGHMPRNFGTIADDLMPAVEIPFCGAPASATAATYPPDLSPALRRKLRQAR